MRDVDEMAVARLFQQQQLLINQLVITVVLQLVMTNWFWAQQQTINNHVNVRDVDEMPVTVAADLFEESFADYA